MSFFTFIRSDIPTSFMTLIWSKHKRWVQNSNNRSVMLPSEGVARVVGHDMFSDITDPGSGMVQGKCLDRANEVASYVARYRPGHWRLSGPGSEQTW